MIVLTLFNTRSALGFLLFITLSLNYNLGYSFFVFGGKIILSFSRIAIFSFLIVFVIKLIRDKIYFDLQPWKLIIKHKLFKFIVFFLVYLFCMSFNDNLVLQSYNFKDFLSERYFLGFIFLIISWISFRNFRDLGHLKIPLFCSFTILTIYGLIELFSSRDIMTYSFWQDFLISTADYDEKFMWADELNSRSNFLRLKGSFWNSIIYSIALTFALPYFEFFNFKWFKYFVISLAFLTVGRTAILSILLWQVLKLKLRSWKFYFSVFIIVITLVLFNFLLFSEQLDDISDQSFFDFSSRLDTIGLLDAIDFQRLFLGFGPGAFHYFIIEHDVLLPGFFVGDNGLYNSIFTLGFFGSLFFLYIFYTIFAELKKTQFETNMETVEVRNALRIMLIIQLSIFLVSNSIFSDTRLVLAFFILIGASLGVTMPAGSGNKSYKEFNLNL
jgi:hypothetical protein